MSNYSRDFKGIWIPKNLWLDKRLTPMEKILAAEIDSLDCGPDHCYASNEYFGTFFDLHERSISQMITKLRNLGLIEVHSFDGRTRRLKSNLESAYAEFYGSASQAPKSSKPNFTGLPTTLHEPSPIGDFIERDNKDYNKDKESPIIPKGDGMPAAPSQPKKRQKSKEVPLERAPEVVTTQKQHENLLEKLEGNIERLQACYNKLSEWKISKSLSGGNDYLSILKWVLRAVEREDSKPKPQERESLDKSIVNAVKNKFPDHKDIEYGYNYIEFRRGYSTDYIKAGDHNFKDQVCNAMRKMGLDPAVVDELK